MNPAAGCRGYSLFSSMGRDGSPKPSLTIEYESLAVPRLDAVPQKYLALQCYIKLKFAAKDLTDLGCEMSEDAKHSESTSVCTMRALLIAG